ncbi:MAG: NADH-dependent flavin oxidoreductase [Streptococcaceae bacterium]|jgi:2,4-dienoyl-CoA reductase-like NADH-dependent reductase (Old Yellow Enzyme family)|nr:NADH-dependent flavin oxidoreductase [Streptococcaceae bacterium]
MTNFNFNFKEEIHFNSSKSTLRNRLIMAPMTTLQSFYNGAVTEEEIQYYRARANGVGAIITGAANVEDLGKGWEGELSIAHDQMLPKLTKLAKAIHEGGAKSIVQIFHGGRMSDPAALNGAQAVSASAIAAERPNAITPREMTEAEIEATITAFGEATRRAIEAGFDGVELHGANTYLLQQFFSPHSNRRTDKWGGSIENRYRFIDEVLKSAFAVVDKYATKPFIVGYRFSPEEFETPGIRFDDTLWLVDQLAESRLDYLHVSLNFYSRIARSEAHQDKSILAYLHERLAGRKALVGVGGVRTTEDIANILGNAELVAVGQQLIVDPTWVEKISTNRENEAVTKSFDEAFRELDLTEPLHNFLDARYNSSPLI